MRTILVLLIVLVNGSPTGQNVVALSMPKFRKKRGYVNCPKPPLIATSGA